MLRTTYREMVNKKMNVLVGMRSGLEMRFGNHNSWMVIEVEG